MHLDNTYNIKEIAGEKVIILRSKTGADMTKLISFNTTSEKLWNEFINKDFTVKDAADFLVKEYGHCEQHDDERAAEGQRHHYIDLQPLIS